MNVEGEEGTKIGGQGTGVFLQLSVYGLWVLRNSKWPLRSCRVVYVVADNAVVVFETKCYKF